MNKEIVYPKLEKYLYIKCLICEQLIKKLCEGMTTNDKTKIADMPYCIKYNPEIEKNDKIKKI